MPINFKLKQEKAYILIHFELVGILEPCELKTMTPPDAIALDFAHQGVILSGRGPIWLYGFLIHYYHPTAWVATYDPRLRGAVIIESHILDKEVGDVIPLSTNQFV